MAKQHYQITVNGEAKDVLAEPRELRLSGSELLLERVEPAVEALHLRAGVVEL